MQALKNACPFRVPEPDDEANAALQMHLCRGPISMYFHHRSQMITSGDHATSVITASNNARSCRVP
jgi:hypothetical protein